MKRNALTLSLASCLCGCFEPGPLDEPMDTSSTGDIAQDASSTAASPEGGSSGEDDEDIEFHDSFEQDLGRWRFVDDPGAVEEGPGNWIYVGGDLVQDADISGAETDNPSFGTYALGGDFDWDAYVVEVTYTADDDGVAGVLCHVTSGGDFIRFDLDHETGIVRLVRKEGSVMSVLEEVRVFDTPMALDVQRTLTLECGGSYRGFVDGELSIEAEGSVDAEGGVGMYASSIGDGPSGLRFHDISVSDD